MPAPITPQDIAAVHDRNSFFALLRDKLSWPIPDGVEIEDLMYGWNPEEIGVKKEDLRGSTIAQLRPFAETQPWGVFILQLQQPRLYLTELRKILRGLKPLKRLGKNHPTWKPEHVLFICTPDWRNYTFAHFEGENEHTAKITTFGWEYQSPFVRTLCEFNIPQLVYPRTVDMFGLDPDAWKAQWSAAFDVKVVTKKFYEEYDLVFREMKRTLAPALKVSPKLYDKKYEDWSHKEQKIEEPVHLFAQNLVNRLMFLKFLEKRRWLDFESNYLQNLYDKATSHGHNFYRRYLEFVFFAGLNRQVPRVLYDGNGTVLEDQLWQQEIGVLPFLNGGLFEKTEKDVDIEIPNEAFKSLFDLFNRYNFTINEDTPLDVEVAVNPEMLGKVFEESVIARKEKGAYYTPREIVSFMCREALKNHLASQSGIDDGKQKIARLVDEHSADLLNDHDALEIYKGLYSIKVLDPAVGSGAYPVGMMFEILECYKAIGTKLENDHPYLFQNKLANPSDVYRLKKQIIQNNLYGVDIEEFAVNIARLRFWLSLAVDSPNQFESREDFLANIHKIDALPNLLYKVKRGDSLIAKYHGVSLEPHGRLADGEFARGRKNRIASGVKAVANDKQKFYGESDSVRKKNIQRSVESALKSLVAKELEVEIAGLQEEVSQHGLFGMTKKEKEVHEQQLDEIKRLTEARDELLKAETLPDDFPMIWDVDFGDVLAAGDPLAGSGQGPSTGSGQDPSAGSGQGPSTGSGQGPSTGSGQGFDVVIANPPYVRQEEIKDLKEDLALHYRCYTGTADLYTYFYERAIRLLKPGGTLAFISSNKYFRAGYGAKLREYLLRNTAIHSLIDFGDAPVFKAIAYPSVIVAQKRTTPTSPPCQGGDEGEVKVGILHARTIATQEELDNFERVFRSTAIEMNQSDLSVEGWRIEDRRVLDLFEKIKRAGTPLQEYVGGKIYYGIKTGYNEAFVIDEATKKRLIKEDKKSAEVIKPFLRGRDIKRYAIEDPKLWLIYVPYKWTNENRKKKAAGAFFKSELPAIYNHLKPFENQLGKRDDQGEFWWEMRPCKYLEEFEKPKIIVPAIIQVPSFQLDTQGFYSNDKTTIIMSDSQFLLGVLNSSISKYFMRSTAATRQGGYLEYKPMYVSQLPIAKPTENERREIESRVEKILKARHPSTAPRKQRGTPLRVTDADTTKLEREIDGIVYEMYGLSEEEIKVVEGTK